MRNRNIYCYFEGKLWGIFLPPHYEAALYMKKLLCRSVNEQIQERFIIL